jgi:hypothetical protein
VDPATPDRSKKAADLVVLIWPSLPESTIPTPLYRRRCDGRERMSYNRSVAARVRRDSACLFAAAAVACSRWRLPKDHTTFHHHCRLEPRALHRERPTTVGVNGSKSCSPGQAFRVDRLLGSAVTDLIPTKFRRCAEATEDCRL